MELEDAVVSADRANANVNALEKRNKGFDKVSFLMIIISLCLFQYIHIIFCVFHF